MMDRGQRILYVARKTDKNSENYLQKQKNVSTNLATASHSGLRTGLRVISVTVAIFTGNGCPRPLPPPTHVVVTFGIVRQLSEAVRSSCRQFCQCNLAHRECVVKFPLPPPARDMVKFGVVRGPSEVTSLGSAQSQN